jgi:signal transduction histidine kinase
MKVLIAEDDPISQRLLQSHLEKWGHEVTAASGGAEAWDLFQVGTQQIVITDWMMPDIDGLELVRRIRSFNRPGYVYVILLTARNRKEDMVQGMEAGADDYVGKPFDREELRVRVRQGERIIRLEHTLAEQNKALREAQASLVQSEKLASLGRLAAGMAHEINNPIAYVSNNIAVLRRDLQSAMSVLDLYRSGHAAEASRREEEIDLEFFRQNFPRLCDKAAEGLQRVRDIVQNLRDFAHLDEAAFKEADLNAALESALEVLCHEIKKKDVRVDRLLQPVPPLLCHPGKINQVFLHLLANALDASRSGGVITVRSRLDGDSTVVEIEDNGCGIPEEHLPRLFEPFFTTKPVGEGTGLGLSVSFGIVRDHGGTLEVESEVRRGSTFRVRLPQRPPRPLLL